MNADADFIAAICANPDDDALRLVDADWLEEPGDARGEFGRLDMTGWNGLSKKSATISKRSSEQPSMFITIGSSRPISPILTNIHKRFILLARRVSPMNRIEPSRVLLSRALDLVFARRLTAQRSFDDVDQRLRHGLERFLFLDDRSEHHESGVPAVRQCGGDIGHVSVEGEAVTVLP